MVTRTEKKRRARNWAQKQYERQRRHNKAFAEPGIHDFIIILDNLKPSFNIGKIFRSADAFGAHQVHLIGIDYFSTKSAKGSFKYVPAYFHDTFHECYEMLDQQGYRFFIFEPGTKVSFTQLDIPMKSAFIFGHEEHGISFDPADFENLTSVTIPQFGRVESLNVSIAASIVMWEYVRQYGRKDD